jgi:hypothetical protein
MKRHTKYLSSGLYGERQVIKKIRKAFPSNRYYLLNNITLRSGKGTTQIDHIFISEYGLFVIETKNYTGWIFGSQYKKVWTQAIYKKKSSFQNPLHQNYKHIQVLKKYFHGLPDNSFQSVIVFTDKSTFKTVLPDNVLHLANLTHYLHSFDKKHFSSHRVRSIASKLESIRLKVSKKTDKEHIKYIKSKKRS